MIFQFKIMHLRFSADLDLLRIASRTAPRFANARREVTRDDRDSASRAFSDANGLRCLTRETTLRHEKWPL